MIFQIEEKVALITGGASGIGLKYAKALLRSEAKNGVVHGMLLGINVYLPKYKTGSDAVIVNISSTAATINGCGHIPVYTATKHAILGLTMSWGFPEFYQHNKVRVIAVCPGITNTPMVDRMSFANWGGIYKEWLDKRQVNFVIQEPGFVADEVMKVIRHAANGSIWIVDYGQTAYEYIMPFMTTMQNNVIC